MARIIGDLDDLAATVEGTARSRAKDRMANARRRAEEIRAGAEEKAERVRQEILGEARAHAEADRRQRLAEARLVAKRKQLAAREELLDDVWAQAEAHLRDLVEGDGYAEVLRRLAWLAVETLGAGRLVLAADPSGHDLLTEERLRAWSEEAGDTFGAAVSFERAAGPADTWGGLIATEAEGRRRLDATFPTRLELACEDVRDAVFRRLVPDS